MEAIRDGTALAVSNGLFKDGCSMAAWTIEGSLAKDKITRACLVPGTVEDHSTFTSELMGILGMLLTVYHLLVDYEIELGALQMCCDGKLALGQAASSHPILIIEPHADLVLAICMVQNHSKCQITFKHV